MQYKYLFILPILFIGCKNDPDSGKGPVQPENALSTFEVEPGFKVELVAAEPIIADPVDMEIDEYGRLYVVEMHGYPLDKSGSGKIKLLSDTNGDGTMDEATVFAENLMMPFGLMRWKEGIMVTDAPNILYFEDTNGDGRAEIRDTVLTGFNMVSAQRNIGNPIYGLDNWIYLTSESRGHWKIYKDVFGDLGGDVYFPANPEAASLPQKGMPRTVRFKPDNFKIELTSGETQFGHAFDDWGHHLLGHNANHVYHEVIAAPYLNRNQDLLVSKATQTMSDHGSEIYQITTRPERQLLTNEGIFTSACGITSYSGGAFPAPFNENTSFVAEPVSNLVHVDKIKNDGASFKASRVGAFPNKEFFASTDAWFRPVNMYVGPDGALYVLDYYRQIIEHPEWMSEEAINSGDLYNGKDMGRIYRISPKNGDPADWTSGLKLGDASDKELVAELANPNRWWRSNAQRLLVDRANKEIVPDLVYMAKNEPSPTGRLHALWTLDGLGELKTELIKVALKDTVAGIRENAIRLLEIHISTSPDLEEALLALQDDLDPKVRFQLLCTLGFLDTPESAEVRDKLLFNDLNDKWVQIAALSAFSSETSVLLKKILENFHHDPSASASLVRRLTAMVGNSGEMESVQHLIQKAVLTGTENQSKWQAPVLEGLTQGLKRRKFLSSVLRNEQEVVVKAFFEHPSDQVRKASLNMLKVINIHNKAQAEEAFAKAVLIAEDSTFSDKKRAEAINFLTLKNPAPHAPMLKKLIIPQEKPAVQVAALKALSAIPDQTVSEYVLQQWPAMTAEIRQAAINTFLSSHDRVTLLLDAIEAGKVQKASLSFYQSVRVMTQSDEKIRKRARSMFANKKEEEIVEEYKQALSLKGNGIKGKEIYLQNCAMCHQARGGTMGVSFGPDLGTIKSWQPEGIMANILAPNTSIAAGYELWVVELKNGETVQGIIASETPAAITLKNAGNTEKTIKRQDIKSLKTLDISGMPAGLENNIDQQQMADLLAFLRQI